MTNDVKKTLFKPQKIGEKLGFPKKIKLIRSFCFRDTLTKTNSNTYHSIPIWPFLQDSYRNDIDLT